MHLSHRFNTSMVPYRRYPSLSDDGQPWFPRRAESESVLVEQGHWRFTYVRIAALLGIIAIIVYLAATS